MNCILICKPAESTMKKKVKVRSIEEEYIRFVIFQMLNKDTIKKVAVILRRFDWATHEHLIFKVIYKYLSKSNEMQIKNAASLLSLLKPFRQSIIVNLLNIFLEELRISMDRNDFYDNQHKILICMILSHFYREKLFNSDIIFYVLYMILTYNPDWNLGKRELLADNPLDDVSDTIRIQMVVNILEICGSILNMGTKKDRLIEFMHFLQIYVLSKLYLPLDVENRRSRRIKKRKGSCGNISKNLNPLNFLSPPTVCSKRSTNKISMKSHTIVHTRERPYKCPFCRKRFNQKSNLKRHTRIHTGERPYECTICSKNFRQKSHLNQHLKNHA